MTVRIHALDMTVHVEVVQSFSDEPYIDRQIA